jgi:prepilin-type processing-associated H-X9-DG protein
MIVTARGMHPGTVHVAMADGSVRSVSNQVDPKVWRGAGTRNGREVSRLDEFANWPPAVTDRLRNLCYAANESNDTAASSSTVTGDFVSVAKECQLRRVPLAEQPQLLGRTNPDCDGGVRFERGGDPAVCSRSVR